MCQSANGVGERNKIYIQRSTLLCAPGLVKFVPAVARPFYFVLPGTFLNHDLRRIKETSVHPLRCTFRRSTIATTIHNCKLGRSVGEIQGHSQRCQPALQLTNYRVEPPNVPRKWEKLPYSLCLPKQPIYPYPGYVWWPHPVNGHLMNCLVTLDHLKAIVNND